MDMVDRIKGAIGTQTELARLLGVSRACVSNWKARNRIPVSYVLKIEAATGGQITRHEMRPDIYPVERVARSAA